MPRLRAFGGCVTAVLRTVSAAVVVQTAWLRMCMCVCVRLCACVCTCAYVCVHVYISLQGCQSVLMQVDAAALIDDERSCAHARVGVNLFDIKH